MDGYKEDMEEWKDIRKVGDIIRDIRREAVTPLLLERFKISIRLRCHICE